MAGDDDSYILDDDGRRILIGLTFDETGEFERLDELILDCVPAEPNERRSRDERRWLILYDKHEAAVRRYLSAENANALKGSRWDALAGIRPAKPAQS